MSLTEIINAHLYPVLTRIVDSYLEAWIDVDRILFFYEGIITYNGYQYHPYVDTSEYGLNRSRLNENQPFYEHSGTVQYLRLDKFRVNLRTNSREKHTPSLNLYELHELQYVKVLISFISYINIKPRKMFKLNFV